MLNCLREDLAAAHVLDIEREALAVLDLLLVDGLEAGLLQLAVPRPDDLAARVHGHGRLLPAHLDENGALVVAQGNVVRAPQYT